MGWPGPMTHRQFAAWKLWLEREWDQPSRSDYYLMRIAAEVFRTVAKHPEDVDVRKFRLKFARGSGGKGDENTPPTVEDVQHWDDLIRNEEPDDDRPSNWVSETEGRRDAARQRQRSEDIPRSKLEQESEESSRKRLEHLRSSTTDPTQPTPFSMAQQEDAFSHATWLSRMGPVRVMQEDGTLSEPTYEIPRPPMNPETEAPS